MGSWEEKATKKKKISLFTHEIFIFVMSAEFCPAINSSNNKGKNKPLLVCNAENTNISLCLQVSILGEMLAAQ